MTAHRKTAVWKRRIVYISTVIALTLGVAFVVPLFPAASERLGPFGKVYAIDSPQQKDSADSAGGGSVEEPLTQDATEAIRSLIDSRPMDREFRQLIEARLQAVETRERAVERKERELLQIQRDIEQQLNRLESTREELRQMMEKFKRDQETVAKSGVAAQDSQSQAEARKAEQARQEKIADAAKRFRAIGPDAAAQVMLQMDMETATLLLGNLPAQTVGELFDSMAEITATGTDADKEKLARICRVWDRLLGTAKPVEEAAVPGSGAAQSGQL